MNSDVAGRIKYFCLPVTIGQESLRSGQERKGPLRAALRYHAMNGVTQDQSPSHTSDWSFARRYTHVFQHG